MPVIGPVDEATAVKRLQDAHYIPDPIRMPDKDIATGYAIKTDPAGGSPLPQGEHVKLYISAGKCQGPCPVEVPSVAGLSLAEAVSRLQDRQLSPRINRVPSDRPIDQVIASEPVATTLHPPGTEVLLTVSAGMPSASTTVPTPAASSAEPDLDRPARSENPFSRRSHQTLADLGLKVKTETTHSNAVANGQVLAMTPAAGSKVIRVRR